MALGRLFCPEARLHPLDSEMVERGGVGLGPGLQEAFSP